MSLFNHLLWHNTKHTHWTEYIIIWSYKIWWNSSEWEYVVISTPALHTTCRTNTCMYFMTLHMPVNWKMQMQLCSKIKAQLQSVIPAILCCSFWWKPGPISLLFHHNSDLIPWKICFAVFPFMVIRLLQIQLSCHAQKFVANALSKIWVRAKQIGNRMEKLPVKRALLQHW